ncbi:MAG: hypothetical protein EBU84_05660, partial [Actinobacteria bacterium]|nr:hypothetical protein [Actinomycetota bacterium]
TLVLDAGARFMVLLGRVSWHDRPGYAEVVGGDGVVLWVPRADLVVVRPERGTPSVPTTSQ